MHSLPWQLFLIKEMETKIIDESGLVGFTVGEDGSLLAYYLGDPNDAKAIEEFETAIQRADKLIGSNARKITRTVERLWAYGRGYGAANSYGDIRGNFRPPKNDEANKSAIRLVSRLATKTVTPTPKVDELTEAQIQLQTEIMEAYNEMALNNLDNPDVRRAYEELVIELLEQFDTLPVKVEMCEVMLAKRLEKKALGENGLPNRPDKGPRVRRNIRDGDRRTITIRLKSSPRKDHNQDEIQTKSGSNK